MKVVLGKFVRISDDDFIFKKDKKRYKVKSIKIKLKNHEYVDCFAHKTIKYDVTLWNITESITGATLSSNQQSLIKAKNEAENIMNINGKLALKIKIDKFTLKYGLSPNFKPLRKVLCGNRKK